MRIAILLILLLSLFAAVEISAETKGGSQMSSIDNLIHWLGHDTFRITGGGKVIYTDPFKMDKGGARADLILITHEHYDHCSPEDVAKVAGPETVIVATPDCAGKLKGKVKTVKPGDKLTAAGFDIEVVRAYNTNKKFHPKANDWVGYIFTVEGKRIYLAGDTDHIPEMKDFRADIALLPVSGTYVMTAEEAAQAAKDIKPETAVPMHFGSIVGAKGDAERFKKALEGTSIDVVILREE